MSVTTDAIVGSAGVSARQLHYWISQAAINPTKRGGPGVGHQWSGDDVARIRRIATVLHDLEALGYFDIPVSLVARLWDAQRDCRPGVDVLVCEGTITIRLPK